MYVVYVLSTKQNSRYLDLSIYSTISLLGDSILIHTSVIVDFSEVVVVIFRYGAAPPHSYPSNLRAGVVYPSIQEL
mgnify:CR=1 FL=1